MKACTKLALGATAILLVANTTAVVAANVLNTNGGSKKGGWIAGVEMTFLQPDVDGNTVSFDNGVSSFVSTELADLDDLEGAPRIWLGMEGRRGWGFRARFWDIEVSNGGSYIDLDLPLGLNAETAFAQTRLGACTVDLEMTRRLECGDWRLLGSFGATYADSRIEESFAVNIRADGLSALTNLSREVSGTGITGALEAAHKVGESGFALFGLLRGSITWGDNETSYVGCFVSTDVAQKRGPAKQQSPH